MIEDKEMMTTEILFKGLAYIKSRFGVGGIMAFYIQSKNKKRFYFHVRRIKKSEMLLRRKSSLISAITANVYFLYTVIRGFLFSLRDRELEYAYAVYRSCFRNIELIEGKDLDSDKSKIMVVYKGRERKN